MTFPAYIENALSLADVSWQPGLRAGLQAMHLAEPDYFSELALSSFLPTNGRLFAAFAQPLNSVSYILFGEGPYPRAQSATGVCFMDGAVQYLWQPGIGLTKPVNRATSLRNFIKMLLVAEGALEVQHTSATDLARIANLTCGSGSDWIQTGVELQHNLMQHGLKLLNASLVFRPEVPPVQDAKAWLPFLRTVLQVLSESRQAAVQLILWGKIAEKIRQLPEAQMFTCICSEHPYNLTFIANPVMQALFKPLSLLHQQLPPTP